MGRQRTGSQRGTDKEETKEVCGSKEVELKLLTIKKEHLWAQGKSTNRDPYPLCLNMYIISQLANLNLCSSFYLDIHTFMATWEVGFASGIL